MYRPECVNYLVMISRKYFPNIVFLPHESIFLLTIVFASTVVLINTIHHRFQSHKNEEAVETFSMRIIPRSIHLLCFITNIFWSAKIWLCTTSWNRAILYPRHACSGVKCQSRVRWCLSAHSASARKGRVRLWSYNVMALYKYAYYHHHYHHHHHLTG